MTMTRRIIVYGTHGDARDLADALIEKGVAVREITKMARPTDPRDPRGARQISARDVASEFRASGDLEVIDACIAEFRQRHRDTEMEVKPEMPGSG